MITFHFYLCIIVLKLFKIHIYMKGQRSPLCYGMQPGSYCVISFSIFKVTMKAMCDPPMFYVIVLSLLSFLPYLISQIKSAMLQILHVFKNIIYIYIYNNIVRTDSTVYREVSQMSITN